MNLFKRLKEAWLKILKLQEIVIVEQEASCSTAFVDLDFLCYPLFKFNIINKYVVQCMFYGAELTNFFNNFIVIFFKYYYFIFKL